MRTIVAHNPVSSPLDPSRRRGTALFYLVFAMVTLLGFASLGVDWGRIQTTKTEMLGAADAAARAASNALPGGITATQNAAVAWASYNSADTTSVDIDPTTDVEFGTWDSSARTFTVLTGSARSTANAVRVYVRRTAAKGNATKLFFGALIGRPTLDINVSSTALLSTTGSGYGVAALNGITVNASGHINSYSTASGIYSGATNSNVKSATNWDITMSGNARIYGDGHPGVGRNVNYSGSAQITGSASRLTSALSMPNVTVGSASTVNNNSSIPGAYWSGSNLVFGTSANFTIPAGTYYCTGLNTNNNAIVKTSGAVVIFVAGPITFDNGSLVNSFTPGNLTLKVASSAAVQFINNAQVNCDLYAPQSALTVDNSASLNGAAKANTILIQGNAAINYYEPLNGGYGAPGNTGSGGSSTVSFVK